MELVEYTATSTHQNYPFSLLRGGKTDKKVFTMTPTHLFDAASYVGGNHYEYPTLIYEKNKWGTIEKKKVNYVP